MKPYYTLLVKNGSLWSPEFGDYARKTVNEERKDSFADQECQIICTDDNQNAINAKIKIINDIALEKYRNNKRVALLAIATVAIQENISADATTANIYDKRRMELMQQNGMDRRDAKLFLEVSPQSLVVGE